MDYSASLHKQLMASWSSSSQSRTICTSEHLNNIRLHFGTFENKVKMRILLALLDANKNALAQHATLVKQLLKEASVEGAYEPWITIIAGIVHRNLFGDSGDLDIEASAASKIDELADRILSQIEPMANEQTTDAAHYFLPIELRYLSPELARSCGVELERPQNAEFHCANQPPNFIERMNKQISQQASSRPQILYSDKFGRESATTLEKTVKTTSGIRPSLVDSQTSGGVYRDNKRVAVQQLGFSQIQAINQGLNRKRGNNEPALFPEKKTTLAKKDTSKSSAAGAATSSTLASKSRIESASAAPTDSAPARSDVASAASTASTISAAPSITSGAQIAAPAPAPAPVPAPAPAPAPAQTSVPTSIPVPAPAPAPTPTSAPVLAPALAQTTAPAVAPPAVPASVNSTGPDLQALFAESPLLSEEDKVLITNFFNKVNQDTQTNPTINFKLKATERRNDNGQTILETILLQLNFSDHSWKKVKKTKQLKS